jgi:hypothetical protein
LKKHHKKTENKNDKKLKNKAIFFNKFSSFEGINIKKKTPTSGNNKMLSKIYLIESIFN